MDFIDSKNKDYCSFIDFDISDESYKRVNELTALMVLEKMVKFLKQNDEKQLKKLIINTSYPVSYTHLTLPTNREV